jgi:hypothetical protein
MEPMKPPVPMNPSGALTNKPFSCNQCDKFGADNCVCALWDNAVVLLLEREESLLGSIVDQCGDLVKVAEQQACEMMDILNREA